MCFSTTASFGAGVLLSGAAILAVRKSKRPAQYTLAGIPAFFGLQQFSEGFVWLSLSDEAFASWTHSASFLFLLFAEVIWPVWMPFAMVLLEKERRRRQILFSLLGLGLVVAANSLYHLMTFPFGAKIVEHHIQYHMDFPGYWVHFLLLSYGLVTVLPTFISSIPKMWVLGFPILVSFFFTRVLLPDFIVSVWCFFAAIISVVVIYILADMQHRVSTGKV